MGDAGSTNVPAKASFMAQNLMSKPMPHHASVQALWEHEWKFKCARNIYPFHWARVEDMEVIIQELAAKGINDAYDDRWTETFIPHLQKFELEAQRAEAQGDFKTAEDLYLRGTTLGMMSRFPIIDTATKRNAWTIQKRLYLKGASFWPASVTNVAIPHKYADKAQNEGEVLQVFVRRPPLSHTPPPSRGSPVMIVCTGLDGYRTDSRPIIGKLAAEELGIVVICMELAGTGDAPGAPNDPGSTGRQLDTLFDWITEQKGLDESHVMLWGTSTGGYDALRAAHTHAKRLKVVVAQGGISDLGFSREWLDMADNGEYSFEITKALAIKFGYDSVEKMKAEARDRFSLVKTGIFDMPCTRLVLLNGLTDTIFPIEDSIAATMHGTTPKEMRLAPGGHMGEPQVDPVLRGVMKEFAKAQVQG